MKNLMYKFQNEKEENYNNIVMKKPIAMRCTQEQFDKIRGKLEKAGKKVKHIGDFESEKYLVNDFNFKGVISNIPYEVLEKVKNHYEWHKVYNEKIFLEACGIFENDSIVESVINKFKTRSELGIKKYGVTLDRTDLNTLDWINHAQEEAMDFILYLEKLKNETK